MHYISVFLNNNQQIIRNTKTRIFINTRYIHEKKFKTRKYRHDIKLLNTRSKRYTKFIKNPISNLVYTLNLYS